MKAPAQDDLFAEWIENHRGIVMKVARSFATVAELDDLVQEILLQLWRSAATYRGESKASTWIYRVALNRALTWQRHESARPRASAAFVEVGDIAAPENSEAAHRLARVYEGIRSLPEIDRSLVLLSLDGFSYAEMAAITGISASNAGARLSRARSRLLDRLEADS